MKAMILAAGLGTRLRPLTDKIPKALVKRGDKTLLQLSLEHLKANGIDQVVINVHHLSDQIIGYLENNHNFGMNIAVSDESGDLLDTGGGLIHAAWFFTGNDPFIVRNVDIISDTDLKKLFDYHRMRDGLATLVVRDRQTSRYFLFSRPDHILCGWKNIATGETLLAREGQEDLVPFAFSGIQVVDPEIFSLAGRTGKISLTTLYLRLAKDHGIIAYPDNDSYWEDAGKPGK